MKYTVGALVCVFALLALGACAEAQEYDTTTVYLIQQGNYTAGVDYVYVDSVVVTAVDRKATTYGFHVQERDGGPWSGILCYLNADIPTVNEGDLVAVKGLYQEYFYHSEIDLDNADVTLIQADYGMPDCELLSCNDLSFGAEVDGDWAEKWEGVFICVDTVQVAAIGDYGEWTVVEFHTHPGENPDDDSLRIDEKLIDPTMNPPPLGDSLALIKGVYAEEWDNYRLWPRSTDDLVFMGPSPGPNLVLAYATSDSTCRAHFDRDLNKLSAEDEDNWSFDIGPNIKQVIRLTNPKICEITTTTHMVNQLDSLVACEIYSLEGYPMEGCQKYGLVTGVAPIAYVQTPAYPGTDSSQIEAEEVTVTGVVTSASQSFGGPFFMQDGPGAWNGLYIYYPAAAYALWDSVTIAGVVDEYYGITEITSVDYAVLHGNTPKADWLSDVTPAMLSDSATAEGYECVLVKMDSVYVYTLLDQYDEWDVGAGTDTVHVGDFVNYAVPNPPEYAYPGLGSLINITGCWREYYVYMLEPRNQDDIEFIDPCPAGVRAGDLAVPYLHQNAPNPFASETVLRFSLPSKMKAKLAVYDVSGRLVKVVADGVIEPGEHHVNWNGKDAYGADASPGIYFYRLTTPERTMQNKMVRLR
jgi:hypothetical protein